MGRGLILIVIFIFILRISYSLLGGLYFLALLLKLGGAPFHNWYLSLVQKLSWEIIWVLSIWQKLIPLLIIRKPRFGLLILARILRVRVRRIVRLAQKNVKKILGLSSIFSLGWVLVSFDFRKIIWVQFMVGYGASLLVLLGRLSLSTHSKTQDFLKTMKTSNLIIFFLGFLIVRGIPPFVGFFLKILILFNLVQRSVGLSLIFLIFRLLFIFVYLNVVFLLFTFVTKKYSLNTFISESGYYLIDLVVLNVVLNVFFLISFCNLLHK